MICLLPATGIKVMTIENIERWTRRDVDILACCHLDATISYGFSLSPNSIDRFDAPRHLGSF